MKSICFFNHYHNGDLFNGKAFIKEIISSIPTKYYYAHFNQSIVLLDLDVEYVGNFDISHSEKVLDVGDVVWVNTWIGAYFDKDKPYYGECTLRFLYQMYEEIYESLNKIFNSNLSLNSIDNYFSFVDYSKFNISNVDKFLLENTNKKILFSNGPCLSGQCDYTGNMDLIIETLASSNLDKTFIATHSFDCTLSNVVFTNDIIQSNECDLNEISYLSTFCDIIIGRNSGPFCFASTKNNLKDPNKVFYAFGNKETDCFAYGVDIDCEFIFEYFNTIEDIILSLSSIILKL